MKYKSILISILVILLATSSVFGYGAATHTYFANVLGYRYGILNLHEMYGAVAPDMFNLLFDNPDQDYLWWLTHYKYSKVVNAADSQLMDAFAYGFKSHNEKNGADRTAHIDSFTYPGYGYVNVKREIIAPEIQTQIALLLSGTEYEYLAPELALQIADTAIESAIDYLVSRHQNPGVGIQMILAAGLRSPAVPLLLCRAYIGNLMTKMSFIEGISLIYNAEEQFRQYMILYGAILASPNSLNLMAEQGAELAEQILQQGYGISIDIPPELMAYSLNLAINAVKNDYSKELAKTLRYLQKHM